MSHCLTIQKALTASDVFISTSPSLKAYKTEDGKPTWRFLLIFRRTLPYVRICTSYLETLLDYSMYSVLLYFINRFIVSPILHWPLRALCDLTHDGRWSTYDVSVLKLFNVSFQGKCARIGYHHQQNSPGWVIFLQLARRAALPVRCSMYIVYAFSLVFPYTPPPPVRCLSADQSQHKSNNFAYFLRRLAFAWGSLPSYTVCHNQWKRKLSLLVGSLRVAKSCCLYWADQSHPYDVKE